MTTTKKLPSQDVLKRIYIYYNKVGLLVRRKDNTCGKISEDGYVYDTYRGQTYLTHRLIWKYVTGEDPDTIDHINGDKFDNRWHNLRSVPIEINNRNSKRHPNQKRDIPLSEERKALGFTERHGTLPPPSPESQPTIIINYNIIINEDDFKLPYNDK